MKNKFTVDYLDVGFVASLPIRIPVVSIGSGPPILSILCGVHGDETASLMKRLSVENSLAGSVRIITSANPFAQATHSRATLSDFGNLNREGKGKPDGRPTERLAHTLFEFLRDSTLVIDLHEFKMETPTIVSDQVIAGVIEGLYRVAQNLGIVPGTPDVAPVTAYDTQTIKADRAGIWEPTIALFDTVDETDAMSQIIPFPLIDEQPVLAPSAGTIVQLARRRLVDTGSNLFSIGTVNQKITEALHTAIKGFG